MLWPHSHGKFTARRLMSCGACRFVGGADALSGPPQSQRINRRPECSSEEGDIAKPRPLPPAPPPPWRPDRAPGRDPVPAGTNTGPLLPGRTLPGGDDTSGQHRSAPDWPPTPSGFENSKVEAEAVGFPRLGVCRTLGSPSYHEMAKISLQRTDDGY
ncbi:hypothetical protein NDU88_011917 [Pleurodeles waltl]|uniref:Uncharacterized protein n=1 Tax=Pleurodeles waltl TaxID=8319 RepID=A0AAV7S434_PLEWA|nr:hypothetical protein NDU88_011917 [Pleurodeles waltl]